MAGTNSSRNWKQGKSEIFSSLPNVSIQDELPPQGVLLKPAVKYNIDDGAWSDKVDPSTGSLLYVDPVLRSEHRLTSSGVFDSTSSSNSSLSSIASPEMSPSRQPSCQPSASSLSNRRTHSPSVSEYLSSSPASEHHYSPSMAAKASKKDERRSVERNSPTKSPGGGGGKSATLESRNLDSISLCGDSLPDTRRSLTTYFRSVPEGEQFGSRGLPLDENAACITRVKIDLAQYHIGTDGNPCSLELLGIVPTRGPVTRGHAIFASSRLSLRSHRRHLPGHDPVVIRDVAKGSPAAASQQLHQGDTILAVNGHCVDMSNVDSVLSGVIDEVQLMVRKHSLQLPLSPDPGSPSLSKLVAGSKVTLRSLSHSLRSLPHLLLYLTLDTREDDHPDMDILYRYPPEGAERLLQTRGLFLTLSDIVGSIGHNALSCSSLILDGRLQTLLSLYHIQLLVKELQQTLELMFGSLASAFKKRENHPSLDHIFSMFFQKTLAPLPCWGTSLLKGVARAPVLSIPLDHRLKLSAALTELDSVDRSSLPEVMCVPSPYRVVGSCFFYQGTLVCSHLGNSDLQSVVRFCHAHRLLELTAAESVNQIVIWRQVWLPSADASSEDHTYFLHRGNTYMLVFGVERVIVCMVLESRHTGVMGGVAALDTTLVESANTLVAEMRAKGLLEGLERRVCTTTPFPSLVLADIAMATMFSSRHHNMSHLVDNQGSESEDESSPLGSRRTASVSLFKFQKKDLSLPSLSRMGGHSKASIVGVPRPADMLNAGAETIVLHYIDLHAERGVVVCPIHTIPTGAVHKEVLECFAEVCGCIRQTLWRRRSGKGMGEEDDYFDGDDGEEEEEGHWQHPVASSTPPPSLKSPPCPTVIEQGVLLSCSMDQSSTNKHQAPSFDYWVVGRLFPDTGRELYVCFVDNTSQNIIEMAFRLAFGTTY
eukprot:Em0022g399a